MGFKMYVPPKTMPKTIRKGMTMGSLPLWAWPIFGETYDIGDGLPAEVTEAAHAATRNKLVRDANSTIQRGFSWEDEWDPFSVKFRKREIENATDGYDGRSRNDYLTNDFYSYREPENTDREKLAGEFFYAVRGRYYNKGASEKEDAVINVVLNANIPKKYQWAVDNDAFYIRSVKRDGAAIHILWSNGVSESFGFDEGATYLYQTIKGKKSTVYALGFGWRNVGDLWESIEDYGKISGYNEFKKHNHDEKNPFSLLTSPSGEILSDESGRAYIEFAMGTHEYTATVPSLWTLNAWLDGESKNVKSATIGDIRKGSPFTRAHLEMVLALHGIEVK